MCRERLSDSPDCRSRFDNAESNSGKVQGENAAVKQLATCSEQQAGIGGIGVNPTLGRSTCADSAWYSRAATGGGNSHERAAITPHAWCSSAPGVRSSTVPPSARRAGKRHRVLLLANMGDRFHREVDLTAGRQMARGNGFRSESAGGARGVSGRPQPFTTMNRNTCADELPALSVAANAAS